MMKRDYFLGGNTPLGFFSYFDNLADLKKINKYYVLKGGPGTGKSTTMKAVAKWAENAGYDVDYIHCSSDPHSLDGIWIKEIKVAMVDGTSPHVVDPKYPACADTIINMGDFWNENEIKKSKEKIIAVTDRISNYFKMAYNYLSAAGGLYQNVLNNCIINPNNNLINDLALNIAEREVPKISLNGEGRIRRLFASSVCPNGIESYASTLGGEKNYVLQAEINPANSLLLKRLTAYLCERSYDVECFFDPLAPDSRIEHIYVPELKLSVRTKNRYNNVSADNVIDLDVMVDKNVCGEDLSFCKSQMDAMIEKAASVIRTAKANHDVLEAYYVPHMCFDKVEEMRATLIEEISSFA